MLLGIDQGTTGTTAVILNFKGRVLGRFTSPVRQYFPKPGWVEHDPNDIWKTVERSVTGALRRAKISSSKIRAIGLTNQRETVSLFQGSAALHRFVVWQDRRTSDFCASLKDREAFVLKTAGTPIDPYFSASKIRWLLDHLNLRSMGSDLRFRTIDSFLLHKLTGADVIEASNASRTSLMDLERVSWSQALFDLYGIPQSLAPRIVSSQNSELKTRGLRFLPDGIPVAGILGDQQAALFGQLGWNPGVGKITFGTGSFILLNTGDSVVRSTNKLVSTLALQWANGKSLYALEGSAFICGAWIQWLRDQLKIISKSSDSEALAKKTASSHGVIVVPALSGLGAPFWSPETRGAILGLSRGSSKADIALASLEALAFQNKSLIDAMRADSSLQRFAWRVDGGAVANRLLMQIQADVIGTNIDEPTNLEATASGAALLAAHQCGLMSLEGIESSWKLKRTYKPSVLSEHRARLYQDWLKAVEQLIGHHS